MPPFAILHICMGNICRSPMAERLLARAITERVGDQSDTLIYSSSAGTGGWHAGEQMNPPAARQVLTRGGVADGFQARRLSPAHLDAADLILTATGEQIDYVVELRPDARQRAFVLGEFARLLPKIDMAGLPRYAPDPDMVQSRGVALVAAVDAARAGGSARPGDDLDDPWGRGDAVFTRVADEIDHAVRPLAAALLPD